MRCKICSSETQIFAKAKVMNRHTIDYYHCPACNFVMTEEPFWLKEAYEDPISIYDTGVLARNLSLSRRVSTVIYFLFAKNGRFLDYAGGYGLFTRRMRDIGFDFYWYDPHSANLMARGFELVDGDSNFELVSCFEVFEHLVDPLKEIEKMFQYSDSILFSTQLLPADIPRPGQWWYYVPESGQHVSFYAFETLRYIAKMFNCSLYTCSNSSLHLLTKRTLSPLLFKLLPKLSRYGLSFYVKMRMKSKTVEDSNLSGLCKKKDRL